MHVSLKVRADEKSRWQGYQYTVLFCQIRHKTGSSAFEENCTNLEPNSEYGINSHI